MGCVLSVKLCSQSKQTSQKPIERCCHGKNADTAALEAESWASPLSPDCCKGPSLVCCFPLAHPLFLHCTTAFIISASGHLMPPLKAHQYPPISCVLWGPALGRCLWNNSICVSCKTGASQVALVVKNPPSQCRRPKRHEFNHWVGKICWRRAYLPTPVLLSGESHGQRSLAS